VTVSPEYRRLGVATNLMAFLEDVSREIYNAYFVDLFVRITNKLAQIMYKNLQYTVFRQVCFLCDILRVMIHFHFVSGSGLLFGSRGRIRHAKGPAARRL
jgi:GNAT superfamily N-acetyltransferase